MKSLKIYILLLILIPFNSISQTLEEDLLDAAYENDEKEIFELLRRGADVNTKTDLGVTPLMYAVQNGNYLISEELLKAGANPNISSKGTPAALINAVLNNDTALVYLLLEYGANPNTVHYWEQKTPLLYTIKKNNFVLTELLLLYGANPNKEINYITPLIQTINSKADTSIINLLIKYGADVNKQNESGYTPLMQSVFYNNIKAAKILLKNGANPEIKDKKEEKNALDYAYKYHLVEMCDLLMPYFKKDAKKYHKKALFDDFQKMAKKIRKTTGKKYLTPFFTHFVIAPKIIFTYDDLFMGAKLAFSEARFNMDVYCGILPRLFRKRVFISQSTNNSLQLWEKRTVLFFGIQKNINLAYKDEKVFGMYLRTSGNYSLGEYYGSSIKLKKGFVPSASIGYWSKVNFFRFSAGYTFMPLQTNFPHYISLCFAFYIPLKR